MSFFNPGVVPAQDSDGNPITGATWSFYAIGTTTPQSVYADGELTTILGTVITSDAAGRFPPAYYDDNLLYSAILRTAEGAVIFEIADLNSANALAATLAAIEAAIAEEAAVRAQADADLDERVDLLESTTISGIRAYETYADLEAAFQDYDNLAAYVIDDTVLDQEMWWVNILASTGVAPPTYPDTDNANWRLITATPSGYIAQVSREDDGNTHIDPVFGGTVDNPGVYKWFDEDDAWGRIFDLDSMIAEGFADDAEAAAATLGGAADLGMIPTKPSNTAGEIEWISRTTASLQPQQEVDITDTGEWQGYCSLTTPGTRFTATVVGDEVEIENVDTVNIFPAGIVTGNLVRSGNTYTSRMRTASGDYTVAGCAIFLSQASTPGGAAIQSQAGDMHIVVRANGTCQVLDHLWSGTFGGATISEPNVPIHTDEEVVMSLEMTSSTSAILYISIGGQQVAPKEITGIPNNRYFGGAIRLDGPDGTVGYVSELSLTAPSFDMPKRLYINGGAVGGTGSYALPYGTFNEAIEDFRVDTARRTLDISLKGGTITDSLKIDMTRWREVTIRGLKGQRPIINPTTQIATTWTNFLGSEVWYTDKPFYFDGNRSYGTLIDITSGRTFAFGRTGMYTATEKGVFGRNAANVAYNDATFVRGSVSVHTTGTYDGMILCRMHDGSDPNDATLEYTQYDYAISAISSNETNGWNVGRVNIEGIDIHGAFLAGVNLRRVNYHLEDVLSECHGFYGFELDQCSGRGYGLRTEATGADGYHWSGTAPASARLARSQLFDCWALGQLSIDDFSFWGDGFSNHSADMHAVTMYGCGSIGAGKSGIASSGAVQLHNFVAKDAISGGVELYGVSSDPQETTIDMWGGELAGNNYGIYCHTDATIGSTRTVNADQVLFRDNVNSSVFSASTGAGSSSPVNMVDCRYLGATPSAGHKRLFGAGSSINVETSTPAT